VTAGDDARKPLTAPATGQRTGTDEQGRHALDTAAVLQRASSPARPGSPTPSMPGGWPCPELVEEPVRRRHHPVMAALALHHPQPPVGDLDILKPQPQHLAAAQPRQQHAQHHRPVPRN
jgi:hypothetical protein